MIAEAALVWLAQEPPSDEARRALDTWGSARDVRLVTPRDSATKAIAIDFSISDRVEQELDRAREAIAAHEVAVAERALVNAERELLAHPELPQAAWLLAEVERAWAVRFMRIAPIDAERAEKAWARAAALDGGRASGVGEPRAGAAAPTVKATITMSAGTTLVVTLDGVAITAGPIERAAGTHQLIVTRDGTTAWAAWVTFAEGATVAVPDLAGAPCSTDDVARARFTGDGVDARGVRCPRWIAALPFGAVTEGAGTTIRVASCERERCGPLLEWRAPRGGDFIPAPPGVAPFKWPAWGTWTLVGAGAVAVGVVVLVASGVFAPTHNETRFVNGGIKPQGGSATFSF